MYRGVPMYRCPFSSRLCLAMMLAAACVASRSPGEAPTVNFEREVLGILQRRCQKCHAPTTKKAGLDLSSAETLLAGGESGPAVVAGDLEQSRLWQLVTSGEMPPEGEGALSANELAAIRRWIESGAGTEARRTSSRKLGYLDVAPILLRHCAPCHGRQKQEGGFDVRTYARIQSGGKSGPGFIPGKPDESRLVLRIAAGEMPPKTQLAAFSVKPVEEANLRQLRDWIAQGAEDSEWRADVPNGEPDPLVSEKDRQFWSFQPPRSAPLPEWVDNSAGNAIDVFVSQRLAAVGLRLAPAADRPTLLRRVHYDLLGLPPDRALVERFAADTRPQAYERLVDQLLASPRYGERWAQYWLDLAGYADSEGVQDGDPVRPDAYRFRDYVIRSLNDDKPYDRFLMEQLAGDELADYEHAPEITQEIYDNLVATGFLRMSADGTFAGITGFLPDRLDVIDDQLRVLGSAVMGLTIGCARCHSHKFDPFPQRDYYRLAALWKGALDEYDWLKPTRQQGPAGTRDRYLPHVTREERAAWEAAEKKTEAQLAELKRRLDEVKQDAAQRKEVEAQIKVVESQRLPEPLIRALWDRGEPSPTFLLQRGDYLSPSRLVGPGFPSMLTDGKTPVDAQPPWPGAKQTGLRLAFARWLVLPDHPLTGRVMVNRVWKHHFGDGLVRTLDNFGHTGERPTHPELLDWLAREFIRQGWSLKSLHRLMLTSRTYQQQSRVVPGSVPVDPDNRLLSRMPLRRLDAEALGDTLLLLADRLNLRMFGPGDPVESRPDGLVTPVAQAGTRRRNVYILQRRTQPLTLLADFDRPAMNPNCVIRSESTVAPQALHLLNNRMIHELSLAFAERVIAETGADPEAQVRAVHAWATGRLLTVEEAAAAQQSLQELRTAWRKQPGAAGGSETALEPERNRRALGNFCHAVMNSAALLFVD